MDISLDVERLLGMLRPGQAGQQLYRVVDPLDAPERRLTTQQLSECGVLANPFLALAPTKQLYLQREELDDALLRDAVTAEIARLDEPSGGARPFCGWILSEYALPTVVGYLQRKLTLVSPEGKAALFRFHDPRVLQRLTAILTQAQLSRLLGPVNSWFYFDHKKCLCEVAPHGNKRHLGRLHVLPEQWQSIRRISIVNECLASLKHQRWAQSAEISLDAIDRLVMSAQECGLSDSKDIRFFVMHGLYSHKDFYRHPIITRLLPRLASNRSYVALTNSITGNDWATISKDMREAVNDE